MWKGEKVFCFLFYVFVFVFVFLFLNSTLECGIVLFASYFALGPGCCHIATAVCGESTRAQPCRRRAVAPDADEEALAILEVWVLLLAIGSSLAKLGFCMPRTMRLTFCFSQQC